MSKTRTERFRARFAGADTNTNCLTNVACPKCGSRGPFKVEVITVIEMHDSGTDQHEDTEPTGRYTQCKDCGHEGRDKAFWFPGLDET